MGRSSTSPSATLRNPLTDMKTVTLVNQGISSHATLKDIWCVAPICMAPLCAVLHGD